MTCEVSLEGYITSIILALLFVFFGLILKVSISFLRSTRLYEFASVRDEIIKPILHRKDNFQTFTRICLWNIGISFTVICSGAISLGILPIVWAFFNLGLFSPDADFFKQYLHAWIEETANILSAALGLWIGRNIQIFVRDFLTLMEMIIFIFTLYVVSAKVETAEIKL